MTRAGGVVPVHGELQGTPAAGETGACASRRAPYFLGVLGGGVELFGELDELFELPGVLEFGEPGVVGDVLDGELGVVGDVGGVVVDDGEEEGLVDVEGLDAEGLDAEGLDAEGSDVEGLVDVGGLEVDGLVDVDGELGDDDRGAAPDVAAPAPVAPEAPPDAPAPPDCACAAIALAKVKLTAIAM